MNSSFLCHVFGIKGYEYKSCDAQVNKIVVKLQAKDHLLRCPCCCSRHIVRNGVRVRRFIGLPIGWKKSIFEVPIQRYVCRECGRDFYQHISFADGQHSYTRYFARLVVDLLKIGTIKDVADFLQVSWDMVKDIHKRHLKRRHGCPSLKGVRNIGIDEFAVCKGRIYKTVVVDMDSGRIIYVGNGKGKDALKPFWRRVHKCGVKIENVATDLSGAYTGSVKDNIPQANIVLDHFHVVKLVNEAVDAVRRYMFSTTTDPIYRKMIKGTRWLLLMNGEDIVGLKPRTKLETALSLNEPLARAYYLKEAAREIWKQPDKAAGEAVLLDWARQARSSGLPPMVKAANTILAHRSGILAWYDGHLSTGKVEGINNKIKVLKRVAYGFRDDKYFTLRLFALHENRITLNCG